MLFAGDHIWLCYLRAMGFCLVWYCGPGSSMAQLNFASALQVPCIKNKVSKFFAFVSSSLCLKSLSCFVQVITSGCATFEPWASALGGIVGGLIVLPGSLFVLHVLKVDDPVDAVTVS